MKLTPAQSKAIDYIGRHRKTKPKVGKGRPLSVRMLNTLKRFHLVMQYGNIIMLTAEGERIFTKMHPHSKYRIN